MTADELRRLMAEHGLETQGDLADLLGVHRITVHRWLSGKTPIGAGVAALVREKLRTRRR